MIPWTCQYACILERRTAAYRNVTQDRQQDVDEEVRIAAALEEDTQRGQEDGEDGLDEVGGGDRHVGQVMCRSGMEIVGR